MAEALNNATAKFRDTMNEMRGMTGQIQRELENTRAELHRGVVELPQETQETTANMRRVVADQIKALNELSALVSRSNRVVDAAPAGAAAPGQRGVDRGGRGGGRTTPRTSGRAAPMPVNAPAATFARHVEPKARRHPLLSQVQTPPCQRPRRCVRPRRRRSALPRAVRTRPPAAAVGCPVSSIAPPATKRRPRTSRCSSRSLAGQQP